MRRRPAPEGLELRGTPAGALTPAEKESVHALFGRNYDRANHAYLDKSLTVLSHVALATSGDELVGFALGEARVVDLPRLPGQLVCLAGLACVEPEFRRRGLFGALEYVAFFPDGDQPDARLLMCGRMAHPASFRSMRIALGVVPRTGVRPSPWQQEVGRAVAAAYGTRDFDPETFVCIGSGEPIGYPSMDIALPPEEWEVFAPVDRDRGDSLLGMCWLPHPPPGW